MQFFTIFPFFTPPKTYKLNQIIDNNIDAEKNPPLTNNLDQAPSTPNVSGPPDDDNDNDYGHAVRRPSRLNYLSQTPIIEEEEGSMLLLIVL